MRHRMIIRSLRTTQSKTSSLYVEDYSFIHSYIHSLVMYSVAVFKYDAVYLGISLPNKTTSRKTVVFIVVAVRTSNFTKYIVCECY
jgi:hypothetical protein